MPEHSPSWKLLAPPEDHLSAAFDQERYSEYIKKHERDFPNLPEGVLGQVLWDHHGHHVFEDHYSHVDWSKVRCELLQLPTGWFSAVHVANEFDWAQENRFAPFDDNLERNRHRATMIAHWREMGTWQVPPVFIEWPSGQVQLVEGHTRLGWLLNLSDTPRDDFRLAQTHSAYLLRPVEERWPFSRTILPNQRPPHRRTPQ